LSVDQTSHRTKSYLTAGNSPLPHIISHCAIRESDQTWFIVSFSLFHYSVRSPWPNFRSKRQVVLGITAQVNCAPMSLILENVPATIRADWYMRVLPIVVAMPLSILPSITRFLPSTLVAVLPAIQLRY